MDVGVDVGVVVDGVEAVGDCLRVSAEGCTRGVPDGFARARVSSAGAAVGAAMTGAAAAAGVSADTDATPTDGLAAEEAAAATRGLIAESLCDATMASAPATAAARSPVLVVRSILERGCGDLRRRTSIVSLRSSCSSEDNGRDFSLSPLRLKCAVADCGAMATASGSDEVDSDVAMGCTDCPLDEAAGVVAVTAAEVVAGASGSGAAGVEKK